MKYIEFKLILFLFLSIISFYFFTVLFLFSFLYPLLNFLCIYESGTQEKIIHMKQKLKLKIQAIYLCIGKDRIKNYYKYRFLTHQILIIVKGTE